MTTSSLETVRAYYDERVEGKLRDFTHPNPRIEAAIQTLAEWAPPEPKRILEIGCGVGATSWRMARAWPQAEVIGADVSPESIDVATTCFRLPNLSYRAGLIEEGVLEGKFDLILMMDVYEHIALEDRASIHAAVKSLLSSESRMVITVPTPVLQEHDRRHNASALQPVDEFVTVGDVVRIANDTDSKLLYYREIGVWQYGDYLHTVLGRYRELVRVSWRQQNPAPLAGFRQHLKSMLRGEQAGAAECSHYLGSDLFRPARRNSVDRFRVSAHERNALASSWHQRSAIRARSRNGKQGG